MAYRSRVCSRSSPLQDVRNATIEALDHAVGLRRAGTGQAVLDRKRGAQLIELMLAAGLFVTGEETIREVLAIIRQELLERQGAHPFCARGNLRAYCGCRPGILMQTKFHLPLLFLSLANLPLPPTPHAQKTAASVKIGSNRPGCGR
jgi:hypothetical protein